MDFKKLLKIGVFLSVLFNTVAFAKTVYVQNNSDYPIQVGATGWIHWRQNVPPHSCSKSFYMASVLCEFIVKYPRYAENDYRYVSSHGCEWHDMIVTIDNPAEPCGCPLVTYCPVDCK